MLEAVEKGARDKQNLLLVNPLAGKTTNLNFDWISKASKDTEEEICFFKPNLFSTNGTE